MGKASIPGFGYQCNDADTQGYVNQFLPGHAAISSGFRPGPNYAAAAARAGEPVPCFGIFYYEVAVEESRSIRRDISVGYVWTCPLIVIRLI